MRESGQARVNVHTQGASTLRERLWCFLIAAVFFHLFLTSNFSASHDSINYLNSILKGEDLFHQHHLLYHFFARQYYVVLHHVAPGVPGFYFVESFTALWGAGTITMCYRLFRDRFGLASINSIAGCCVIAFSFGTWFYSTNVEVYTAPSFFLVWALYVMSGRQFGKKELLQISLLHAAAVLFHQVNILFTLPILLLIYRRRREMSAWQSLTIYALVAGLLVLVVYLFVGIQLENKTFFAEWFQWVKGYTEGHSYWRPLEPGTIFNVAIGFSHAILGGHFLFRLPFTRSFLTNSIDKHGLADEIYLARDIPEFTAYLLLVACVVLLVLVLFLLWLFFKNARKEMHRIPHVISSLTTTLATYSLFFFFWMPEILEFWILQSILFWLLLIGCLPQTVVYKRKVNLMVFGVAILLFCINYFGSIRYMRSRSYDWYYNQIDPVRSQAASGDLVIVQDPWIFAHYLEYYTSATIVSEHLDIGEARAAYTGASRSGSRVFLFRPINNDAYKHAPLIDSILQANPSAKQLSSDIWIID